MRFKGKHRVSKEDLKEDRFQQFTEKAVEAYYRDRQKFWIGAGVVVVAIVGAILLIQNSGKGANSQAEIAFTQAIGVYSTGNMEQAEQAFKDVASRYGRDFLGAKAHFYLGNVYYNNGKFGEAKAEFARFLSRVKKDPLLSPAAQLGIANSEEQLGNNLQAATAYEAVYRGWPKSPLAFDAMMSAGRCYRAANALDKAEAVYKQLEKDKPQGEKGDELKVQLAAIQASKSKF